MYAVKISHTVPLENPPRAKRRPSDGVPAAPWAPGTMISAAPKVTPIRPIAAVGIGSRISAAITVTNSAKNCQAWAESPAGTGLATMTAPRASGATAFQSIFMSCSLVFR